MTSMLRALMQGDFSQWLPLFNRFDEFFEKLTTPRQDVGLKFDGSASPDPPFPLHSCLEVLRVTAILLENCSSKQSYASYEVGTQKTPDGFPMLRQTDDRQLTNMARIPCCLFPSCSTCGHFCQPRTRRWWWQLYRRWWPSSKRLTMPTSGGRGTES
jgi:hypothetical protein